VVYSFKGADMSLGGNFRFAPPIEQDTNNNAYQPLPQFTGDDPYSQIMARMPAFRNPYENFVPGTALGGFDPSLYTRAIQDINGNLYGGDGSGGMAGGDSSPGASMGDGGVSGGGGGGAATDGGEGFSAANSGDFGDTSSVSDGEGSVGDGGVSGGGGGGAADGGDGGAAAGDGGAASGGDGAAGDGGAAGWAMGGLIDRVGGPNPPGPDDGTGYLDLGEYVIKKSAVKKYGRGLLDMINEGKVPAKKIKSLLD
jgi:hypothetical protein